MKYHNMKIYPLLHKVPHQEDVLVEWRHSSRAGLDAVANRKLRVYMPLPGIEPLSSP